MQSEAGVRIEIADWARDARILRAIREAVFVEEQNVPMELEWDGRDPDCTHVIAYVEGGKPVATGRLDADGHIGRLAVLKPWRGRGVGSHVLLALTAIAKSKGFQACALNDAQYCTGCRRSIREIAAWSRMPDEDRRQVLAELPHRDI